MLSASEKEMVDAARAASTDQPHGLRLRPTATAEDVRKLIVEAEAAQQTIDARLSDHRPREAKRAGAWRAAATSP